MAPIDTVITRLREAYPEPTYALNFDGPLQLLVGAILAAQCTDERVNSVTPKLFETFPDAASFAAASVDDISEAIHNISFNRKKAEGIKGACEALVSDHGGEVPSDIDELVKLSRVARKTANLVTTLAFGLPTGIVVDTHVGRVSQRLGLSTQNKGEKIEADLLKIVPESEWVTFGPRMTLLGREVCTASGPKCGECVMSDVCPKVGVS